MDTDLMVLQHFIKHHPLQAAHLLEGIKDEEVSSFMDEIPVELTPALIGQMNVHKAARCLELADPKLVVKILEQMDIRDIVALLRQTNEHSRKDWLDHLPAELSASIRQRLDYPLRSVGSLMRSLTFALRKEMQLKDAISLLKNNQAEVSLVVHVIDVDGKLVGGLHLQQLLFADESDQIGSIMNTEIPRFYAEVPVESVKNHQGWFKYRSIPVVDRSEKLIGLLDYEAVLTTKTQPDMDNAKHALETSTALGELYRIGLTGFLQSISEVK